MVYDLRKEYSLGWLLQIADVSRPGYYKWLRNREHLSTRRLENQEIKKHILAIHKLRPYYGYLRMFNNQNFYLSVIQDLYHNEIVAYQLSDRNDVKLVIDTISKLNKKTDGTETIIHSDQGFQYTSILYNHRLEELGLLGSHSRKGNCLDNACIESFFSHLKTEMLYINKYMTFEELYQAIGDYIEFYNHERFQKRLNYFSPVQYKEAMAA